LLDMRVVLSYDGEAQNTGNSHRRWADVTCRLGNEQCAVKYNTMNNKRHV
jgi:hypothetical protein